MTHLSQILMDFASIWVIFKAESCCTALILYPIVDVRYCGEPEPVSLSVRRYIFFVSFLSLLGLLPQVCSPEYKNVVASSSHLTIYSGAQSSDYSAQEREEREKRKGRKGGVCLTDFPAHSGTCFL